MSALSPDYPLCVEAVPEFLREKSKTLTPSDPPLSAYILGAGFYFEESPTSDRFRSWMSTGVRGFYDPIWLQCDLLCLLMLKSPGPLKPEWLGKEKPDDNSWTGVPEITQSWLMSYLVERVGKEGFRGYSKIPVSSSCPDGRTDFPFQRHYGEPIKEFRPIEVVSGPTPQKVWFETHAIHLWARLNCSNSLYWVASHLYQNLAKPVREEGYESESSDSDDTDSSDEEFKCSFPSIDKQAIRFLCYISPLHHAVLGLAEDSLRECIASAPSLIELTDLNRNTFIYALICLPDPVTEEEKVQYLKIWQATKEVLDGAFPEPSTLKEFLVRRNILGNTVLQEAVVQLNFHAMKMFFTIFKMDPFADVDDKGNTILHVLAGSKGAAKKQLGMLQDLVKLLFDLEVDVEKRERFYQQINHSGDTALQVAANARNKELVQKLMFLPGADTEDKSEAHPKGVDFMGLGIHQGKLLTHECTLLLERNLAFGERLDCQEEVSMQQTEAIRVVIGELNHTRREMGMLADALERSNQRQLLLEEELRSSRQQQLMMMQMMQALLVDKQRDLPALPGHLAAPFLALRDAPRPGAEEAEPEGEVLELKN